MLYDLSGKNALVTGAAGGIGIAVCEALHQQGANVILSGTRRDALETLAVKLNGIRQNSATAFVAYLEQDGAATKLINDIANGITDINNDITGITDSITNGKNTDIDILVNNAGVTKDGLAMRMSDEDWEHVIRVNLTACFHLCRAVLPKMLKKQYGRIINISSVVAVTGNPGQANYVAAKAGMIGLTKSLAAEVAARNITVNAVAPGFITTKMTAAISAERKETVLKAIPAKRAGDPEDVAHAVLYLASKEAGYVTGQTLHVNGGMAMI